MYSPRHKVIQAVWLWALVTTVGGALLAPWLFWGGRFLVHRGLCVFLAPFAFPTYLRRAWLLTALAFAPWLLRRLPARPQAHLHIGWRQLGVGALVGGLGIALLTRGLLVSQWFALRPPPWGTAALRWAAVALGSGILVAAIEELAFRQLLQRSLVHRLGLWLGSALQILAFAAVHFVAAPARGPVQEDVAWDAGLWALLHVVTPPLDTFTQLASPAVWPAFCTLLAAGLTLTVAAWRTAAPWLAMGLHGAWVTGLRYVAQATLRQRPADVWLDTELRAGILPICLALASLLAVSLLPASWLRAAPARSRGAPP